jgi:prepilin signal peptidase PulO-like enzyme (type II secretory pathway)
VISIKGVVIGSLIDVGGSLLTSFLYAIAYVVMLGPERLSPDDIQRRLMSDPSYFGVTLVMGVVFVGVGAYVAARIARERHLVHGGFVGLVDIGAGLVFLPSANLATWPAWYTPLSFGLTLPAALLGAYVAKRRAVAHAGLQTQ